MLIRTILAALAITIIGTAVPGARADEASKQEIISKILDVTQRERVVDQLYGAVAERIVSQVKTRHPEAVKEMESRFLEIAQEGLADLKTDVRRLDLRIWAKHYTEQELGEMLAFLESDTGRKSMEMGLGPAQGTVGWRWPDTGESGSWVERHFYEYFTEEEFAELSAFLESDTGRKAIETAPILAQEFGAWIQQEIGKSTPRIEARVRALLAE